MKRTSKILAVFVVLIAGTFFASSRLIHAAETASQALQPSKAAAKAASKLEASALEPVKIKTIEKKSGTVTGVSATSISVLYEETKSGDYELNLPFDQNIKLDHYRNRSEIKAGDIVELEYEKVVEKKGEQLERITMAVKKIRFVKRPKDVKSLASEKEGK